MKAANGAGQCWLMIESEKANKGVNGDYQRKANWRKQWLYDISIQ